MQEAKRQGLSKQDMMNLSAMGFQETKWGRSDGNIGHVRGDWEGDDSYQQFISAYKEKMKEADRLGITDPATRLQVYNGMGTVTPRTEKDYHGFEMQKIYGVPIPKGGINMKKNPLYGKQVMDIRDNVLAKNPEYLQYMDSIYEAPVPKYMNDPKVKVNKLLLNDPKKHQMGGSVYPVNYVPQAQNGKLTFLQPTSEKLPEGYRIPYADPSSELAMSIGGENGEPAYLIPSFKYGKPLYNPIEEFKKTGEHLGGPFKTWQEADQWEQEVRHPYVEKGQAIPMPIKTWGEMAMGGSIPGSVGFTYARTQSPAPSNGPYAKKTMASAQEGRTITLDEGEGRKKTMLTDSKEYANLYNEGRIGVQNDDESISFNPLNEVVVTPYDKYYPYYQNLSAEEKKHFNDDTPIGRAIRSKAQDNVGFNADKATDFAMGWLRDLPLAGVQAPQSAFVEGVEAIRGNNYDFLDAITPGEQRLPSDVWGIENDYYGVNPLNTMLPPVNYKTIGNTAMDIAADPLLIEGLVRQPLQKGIRQLGNIKTSVAPELQQGLHSNGFFDFFKRKPKSDYPKYRLVTDEDLPISSFNKASKEQIKAMQESNIYKDLANSESKRHQDLMRNIEEYGEGWKYTDEEIANSAKQADDAKANWSNYIDAQEAGIKTNPKFFDNTTDNLVFYKGKDLGKEELQQLAKQEPDQWYGIQGYKETRPNVKGYISDEADYIYSTKYRLPGNRWDTEAMLRDMSEDAEQSFKSYYKNQNWKPNIDDIPLNKQGGIIKDDRGQWDHPGEITQIDQSKEGSYIDMGPDPKTGKPITQKILAVSDTGDVKLMMPGGKYKLNGTKVTEYPIAQTGIVTGKKLNLPDGKAFLEKLKAENAARNDWRNVREVPRTVVNDNIPNAHDMAVKADAALVKQQKYEQKVKADQAKAQAEAQKKFNALPKAEQERIINEQRNQQYGSITQYEPEGFWEKAGNIALAPFTALREKMETGHVPDNLVKGIINDPKNMLNPMDVAYLGTLGYAAAPYIAQGASYVGGVAAPYMALDATVGGTTLTGVNINNLLTAGFATHGLTHIGPDSVKMYENPSWENAFHVAMDVAEVLPVAGTAAKTIGEGFGYVKSKANQALAKTNEVFAPRLDKARTLIDDMGAVISGEKKTIGPKIDAINNAERDLFQSPEYSNFSSESLKLHQQKWAIEGKINQMKRKGSTSELNELNDKMDKLQKRIDVAEQFTVNGEGLVQSGKNTSLGLRTGSTDIMDLATGEKFPISTSVPTSNIVHTLEGDKVVKTLDNLTLPQASPEYGATVKKNIDFIETQIPGAKVFGSAKNVAEAKLPHIIGDYDVIMSQTQYEKFAKANPSVGNNGFAELHNIPGAAKGVDPIDINIIQEKGGKAIGTRAEELFKQMAPDEYYAAAKKAIKDKSEIKIPYSSQELVDMTNPTTKSVVDAYESVKDKHLNKIDALINFGKPSVVAEGQQQFVNSLVGSKGSIGHQFPVEQLSNAEANAKILDKIGFIGNKKLVAADPERMQLAINDYYMNNSILARQVEQGEINKIEAAIKEYYPGAGGGAVNGIGQNHVMLGHPFHGDGNIISMKQLGMKLDTKDPMSYINSIEHQVSGEKLFSQEERDILSDILNNIKFNDHQRQFANQSENTSQLIEKLPYSEEGKKALYEFGKQTNRTIVKKSSQYGNSTYASTLRDFDDAIDAMQYQVANSRNAMKSYKQRSDAAQLTANSEIELLPKQFKAIKGYVEGGIERAKERLDALSKQKRKIYDDVQALSDKAYNKKYKEEIDRLKKLSDKIDKEVSDMAQMRRDLFARKIHLNDLEDKMKTVGILGGGTAALVGVGTYGYKKDQEIQKEFDERLKKMTKEEREQFDKDLQERIRKRDSIQSTDKPSLDKFMDWFMGRKQNGGTITKAKDGNQLVKLNQLTNFTNYNTKQPGGWMDKYQ
jgi:hypothetical protein